jgi:hypothetical protein
MYLASAALVGLATIISFGIASFSFLYSNNEMLRGPGIDEWRAEINSMYSDVFLSIYDRATPIPAEIRSASSSAMGNPPASVAQVPAEIRPQDVSRMNPPFEPLLSGGETSVTKDASRSETVSSPPIPYEQRDWLFHQFEMQRNQHAKVDQQAPSSGDIFLQNLPKSRSYDYLLSHSPAFRRHRMRKECGPIKDSEWRRACVGSLRTH